MSDTLERQAALRAFWSAADALSDGSPPTLPGTRAEDTFADEHDATEPSGEVGDDDRGGDVRGTGVDTVDHGDDEVGTDGDREEADEGTSDEPDRTQIESGDSDVEPHSSERVQAQDQQSDKSDNTSVFDTFGHAYGCF